MSVNPRVFRALVSDIDGTLIDANKGVPAYTRTEIVRVINQYRLSFILASSRSPVSIAALAGSLSLAGPMVAYDGALVLTDPDTAGGRRVLLSHRFEPQAAIDALEVGQRLGLSVGLFEAEEWVVSEVDYWVLREVRGTKVWPAVSPLRPTLERWLADGRSPHKIMMRGDQEVVDQAVRELSAPGANIVRLLRSKATLVEMVSQLADKRHGLEVLLEHLGLDASQVIAFGDNDNDCKLLEYAGYGVAVANASESAIAAANERTLTNDEDGVGLMLRRLFPERPLQ